MEVTNMVDEELTVMKMFDLNVLIDGTRLKEQEIQEIEDFKKENQVEIYIYEVSCHPECSDALIRLARHIDYDFGGTIISCEKLLNDNEKSVKISDWEYDREMNCYIGEDMYQWIEPNQYMTIRELCNNKE